MKDDIFMTDIKLLYLEYSEKIEDMLSIRKKIFIKILLNLKS